MTKQTWRIIFIFCLVKLTLHLIADSHSGFQGDELLHIETGKHLAFGYMEFPPLISILAFLQNLFHSPSVFIHHIFPHLASILLLIFVAKTIIELGGSNRAVFLAMLCILIAPSFGRSQQLFQPVVFSQLFWVMSFYALVRFVNHLDRKSLWLLTLFCILGFLSKYDALFFIAGLSALFLFKRTRTALIQHKFWWNILLALLCISPNLIWQITNDYPALQMFDRLYETQLSSLSRTDVLGKLLMAINPLNSLLIIVPAFIFLFKNNRRLHLPLAVSILLSIAFLSFKNGKTYYFYPIILTLIPFGAIFWEQLLLQKRKWMMYLLSILLLSGAVLIPFGMPVYSFNHYLSEIYPFEKKEIKGGKFAVKYDEYYTKQKWATTLQELKSVYDSLPPQERKITKIWGKHYGQAGAVNVLGSGYNLPKAFSYHGSFYSWAPEGEMPQTILALSYDVGDFFNPYFEEVKLVKTIYNPYADNEEELYQRIYVCKKPRQSFDKMKTLFKTRIFE